MPLRTPNSMTCGDSGGHVVVERAEVDPLDRARAVVPDTVVAGFLDGWELWRARLTTLG